MKAWVYDRYGKAEVLALREVSRPSVLPEEVLVKVRAAALNPKDSFIRKGRFRLLSGTRFPKKVGADFAGEVVELGRTARGLSVGDRVFGMLSEWTYLRGTLAEYVSVRPSEIARKPESSSFEEAAALPLASLTALQALRDVATLRPGDSVAIHGASGGVGTAAVQIAVALGARVTTTSSAKNLELCRSLGASVTFDYAKDAPFSGAQRFRVILDAFGNLDLGRVRSALTADGTYVTTVPSPRIALDTALTLVGSRRARLVIVQPKRADLETIAEMVERKELRAVIDRSFALEDAVDGVRLLETKRTRGKVVIRIVPS